MVLLTVIGFGRRMSFTDEDEVPSGFTMSFKHALRIVADNVVIKVAVPKRALCLTQRFRNVDRAFNELEVTSFLRVASDSCSLIHPGTEAHDVDDTLRKTG